MALNKPTASGIYLSVLALTVKDRQKAVLCRRITDEDELLQNPEARERKTKEGKIVHEEYYDSIDALILGFTIKDATFNGEHIPKASWLVKMKDTSTGTDYILQLPYSSGFSKTFLNALAWIAKNKPNAFSKPLRVRPWMMQDEKDKEKYWRGISVYLPPYTKEEKVAKLYDKEQMPAAVPARYKGKDVWDDEEQMLWWEHKVFDQITPAIQAVAGEVAFDLVPGGMPADQQDQIEAAGERTYPDDLPF